MRQYILKFREGLIRGPFDLYLSGSSGLSLYEHNVYLNQIKSGYPINVEDSSTSSSLVIDSLEYGCNENLNIPFPSMTPSITPSPTPSPVPSPTPSLTPVS